MTFNLLQDRLVGYTPSFLVSSQSKKSLRGRWTTCLKTLRVPEQSWEIDWSFGKDGQTMTASPKQWRSEQHNTTWLSTLRSVKSKTDKCTNNVGHAISTQSTASSQRQKIVKAITDIPGAQMKEEAQRVLGMIQFLSKFLPGLSTINAPVGYTVKKDLEFYWLKHTSEKLKKMCTEAPLLVRFDPNKELTIQCDANLYELGAGLLQEGRAVAFTSKHWTLQNSNMCNQKRKPWL